MLANSIGDSERRHWADPQYREFYKSLWRESPKWFKDAARPYLGKNYQAKPRPKNLMVSEIMDAINEAFQPK
jgi:hypothetical protein